MEVLKKYAARILFLVSFLWALRVLLLPNYPDFQVHYYGAQHLMSGENPYIPDENYFTPQVYPPFDMVFFIPLSFFPYDIAEKIWIIISIAAVLASIVLINRIYKVSFFHPLSLFLSALVFIAFPTKFTFGMGQINAVILFFTTLLWFFLLRKKDVLSGITFAFPVMLKFFPLLFGPYLLFTRRWKVLFILALTMLLMFLVSLPFVSFETHLYFFQTLLPDLLRSWKGDYYNQSFTGLLMRMVSDESLRHALRVLIPIIVIGISYFSIFFKRRGSENNVAIELSLLITVSVLINNFSWQHHFIFLLLPYFVVVYTILQMKKMYMLLTLTAVSYSLIAINFVQPESLPLLLQNHVFFGACVLWIITLYLLVKRKKL